MTKEEHFLYYSKKIQERLIIITMSIRDKVDLSENDTLILKGVFEWYNKDEYPWLDKVIIEEPIAIQKGIFDE